MSWLNLAVLAVGICLWIVYGRLVRDAVIVGVNVVTAMSLLVLFALHTGFNKDEAKPVEMRFRVIDRPPAG